MTDDVLEYYELEDGQRVATSLADLWWAHARVPPLPETPRYYVMTVRQMVIVFGPALLLGVLGPIASIRVTHALFGTSHAVMVTSAIVYATLATAVCWLVLLPLGDWLAGVPLVVDEE